MHPEGGWGLYKVPVLPSPPPPTTQSPQQRKSGEGSPPPPRLQQVWGQKDSGGRRM